MTSLAVTINDGVMTIVLDRPDQLNAISDDMMDALQEALDEAETSDDIRCLSITGAGDAFCAGGDIDTMKERFGSVGAAEQRSYMRNGPQAAIGDLFAVDLPTVAKVDGPAVGAGLGVALACDIVVATEDSTFGAPFVNLGLMVDGGLSYLLPELVGLRRAIDIVYRGEIYSGAEAVEIGLITEAVPSGDIDDYCTELVADLAKGPTEAYKLSKDALQYGATHDMRAALDNESNLQSIAIETEDHKEGVRAFLAEQDPAFSGE